MRQALVTYRFAFESSFGRFSPFFAKIILMNKELIVILCGVFSIFFALFHSGFWKLLNWKTELQKITYPNRGVMQILNIQLIITFLLTAILCLFFTKDLYTTGIGKTFLTGMSFFWLIRFIVQFIFLRMNNRLIHFLTVIFAAGAILFILPVIF